MQKRPVLDVPGRQRRAFPRDKPSPSWSAQNAGTWRNRRLWKLQPPTPQIHILSSAIHSSRTSIIVRTRYNNGLMNLNVLVLPGDGIGVEVTREAVRVLERVAVKFSHKLSHKEGLLGGIAIHKTGSPFPPETENLALEADATLM